MTEELKTVLLQQLTAALDAMNENIRRHPLRHMPSPDDALLLATANVAKYLLVDHKVSG